MADEHDTTIVSSRDTTTARCDPASFQLQQRGIGHGTTTFRPSCEFGHVLMVPPVDCGSSPASSPRPHPLSLPDLSGGGAPLRSRGDPADQDSRRQRQADH
jgi:hypothetical protein